jgi:hypothetical protein
MDGGRGGALRSRSLTPAVLSFYVQRALLLDSPPSMEAREITDKGTLNPAAVLKNRAAALDRLYQEPLADEVLCVDKLSN